jgi:hypothetical protein
MGADRLGERSEDEVGDSHVAFTVEHDVRRLQITVEDTLVVRGGDTRADLSRDLDRLVAGKPADPAQQGAQVLAVDVLHGEVVVAVALADVVHATDVGVRDLPGEAHLLSESEDAVGVPGERSGKELDRDGVIELEIIRAIHLAHAPAAEESHDTVATDEQRTGREHTARGTGIQAADKRRRRRGHGRRR